MVVEAPDALGAPTILVRVHETGTWDQFVRDTEYPMVRIENYGCLAYRFSDSNLPWLILTEDKFEHYR